MTEAQKRFVARKPLIPVAFRLELSPYLAVCERAANEGVTLSEWLRQATMSKLAKQQKGAEHEQRTE